MRLELLKGVALLGAVVVASACGGSDAPVLDAGQTGSTAGTAGDGGPGTAGDGGTTTGDGGTTTTTGPTTGDGGTTNTTSADAGDGCTLEDSAEVAPTPADVVIALDTSSSMAVEICSVAENLSAFADGIGPDTRVTTIYEYGIDSIGLVFALQGLCMKEDPLEDIPIAMDAERYQRVPANVNSTNALQVLLDQYSAYEPFLRPGSPTHFIVVSDDVSQVAADTFRTQMEANLGGSFYFHAIVVTGEEMGGGCGGSVGQDYLDLATATGGEQLSLCADDWSVLFAELEAAVERTANLPCSIPIPPPPPGNVFSKDEVSVFFTQEDQDPTEFLKVPDVASCGDEAAWYFDDEDNPGRIEFCMSGCNLVTESLGDLDIAFGCTPPILQ